MSDFEAWVGKCHIRDGQSPDRRDYQCYAAVWTNTREGFDIALHQHLKPHTQSLLWAEDVHPMSQWLQRGGHNQAVIELARTVHAGHAVILGTVTDIEEGRRPTPLPAYLTITQYEIPPQQNQTPIPFGTKEWIALELKELLFGQPEDGAKLRTYLIVDAALRKTITGVFDLESDLINVPMRCLFKGEKADLLKEAAPYLIDMTLPDGAWQDGDLVPSFHKSFFDKHWGHNTGLFIRTPASFDDVWGHFRKFPRMQVEDDRRWMYFRFWDPRIAPSYYGSIKTIPEKSVQWFEMRNKARIVSLIGDQTDSGDAFSITPDWDNLKGFASIGQPILSDTEMKGFERYKLEKFDRETASEFHQKYPKMKFSLKDLTQISKDIRTWCQRHNVEGERDIKRIMNSYLFIGDPFFSNPACASRIQHIVTDSSLSQKIKADRVVSVVKEFLSHTSNRSIVNESK